jgi:hypothetical protein
MLTRTLAASAAAALTLVFAVPAQADPDPGSSPDEIFAYYLTHDERMPNFIIMDFPTLKMQGLRGCQQWTNGTDHNDVAVQLMDEGGYTIPQAVGIIAAAGKAYCPWIFVHD